MKPFCIAGAVVGFLLGGVPAAGQPGGFALKPVLELRLASEIGQLRAAPVRLGSGAERAFLALHGPDFDVDPWHEMFFYPKGTLKLAVVGAGGRILWQRDLGRSVVPGVWFCPVFPFDLDGDGADEIWFVNNVDRDHPLSLRGLRLEGVDARTGKTLGQWRWPDPAPNQTISHTYRFFILGGHVHGQPVLVTAQGTYAGMRLQAWNPGVTRRWEHTIPPGPGPRGSHMTPVADLDGNGADEILWGERRIDLDTGRQLACADCASYNGHSDVIQPFLDRSSGQWRIFTCRESDPKTRPRVAVFDAAGKRLWGDLDGGHIDMGWVAHLAPQRRLVAMAIRIQSKSLNPRGRFHEGMEEFVYDPLTGRPSDLGFSVYRTVPVDLNGDGWHELVRGLPGGDGAVIDGTGKVLGTLGGSLAMASKFLDLPGEQVLAYYKDGTVRVWAGAAARDSEDARKRYEHPFYRANQRLSGVGYNLINLGGL